MTQTMEFLPWRASFDSGIPEIDDQHRRLVALLNCLARQITSGGDAGALDLTLSGLEGCADEHFKFEESFWQRHLGTDAAQVHRLDHARFRDVLRHLRPVDAMQERHETEEAVLSFVVRWLVSHILVDDLYQHHA